MKRPNMWVKVYAPGIGDLVVMLPFLKNLKENYVNKLNLLVFNKAQVDLLRRFPYVDEQFIIGDKDPRSFVPEGEFYLDIAETEMESKYWWGSEEFIRDFGHMHISEVMKECTEIGGDYENFPSLKFIRMENYKNTVLLGIGGRRRNKLWFNDYWLEIYDLLTKEGYEVYMVGDKRHKGSEQIAVLEKEGIPFLKTDSLAKTVDIISSSAGMVTIDTGLMHISAIQKVPTVALFGPMPSWLWGHQRENVVNLDGGCGINCTKMPLDWECKGRPCMRSLKPKYVFEVFKELKEKLRREETK